MTLLGRVGAGCARHWPWVFAVWLLVLVGATVGHHRLGGEYSDDFTLPHTDAQRGATLLRQHDPAVGGQTGQLVFTAPRGTVADQRSAVEQAAAQVRDLPHVLLVSDPLAAATTAKDGRTAYATVNFDRNPAQFGGGYVDRVDHATAPARAAGVHVDYGGVLGQAARPKASDVKSEAIGIAVAIVVLLLAFGSVYAGGMPILSAALAVVTGLGLLGMLASGITFATVSPTLAVMMGLGVGIDYGLFLITRHRQYVMDGVDPVTAAGRTTAAGGRAVLTAAVTVIIALLGLYASGVGFIGKLGLAGGIAVAVAALAAVTLVPALLGLAGRRIDRLAVRTPVAEAPAGAGGWHRYAAAVGARPWWVLFAGIAVLAVLAVPVLSMRIGHVGPGADPTSYTDRRAYDAISAAFGPGANAPLTVVARLGPDQAGNASATQSPAGSLHDALAATRGVASAGPVNPTQDGALLVGTVLPKTGPQDAATDTLLHALSDHTLPKVLDPAHATGYVTGSIAAQLQFRDQLSKRLPVVIAVVVVAAFLLLLVMFRAPLLALKAAAMNLLSIGAAYGVVVAVFQWGWGGPSLGVAGKVPIESYVPMMMFAIVFGLSMDYEVFLLSRVREVWQRTGDNHGSVAAGLSATGRVISCAALIMASVFLSFLLSSSVVVKMLALGLGASVLIDATVIRLALVPAAMFLFGGSNWWLPRWLDRMLPHVDPEGQEG
ncbi:MAG: MMPL family transporter [Mycobacteriales bacterium]